jgi:hypothetical protein
MSNRRLQREKDKYGFERELMDFLDQAVRDLDRKIARINADLGNTQSFVMSEIDGREEVSTQLCVCEVLPRGD